MYFVLTSDVFQMLMIMVFSRWHPAAGDNVRWESKAFCVSSWSLMCFRCWWLWRVVSGMLQPATTFDDKARRFGGLKLWKYSHGIWNYLDLLRPSIQIFWTCHKRLERQWHDQYNEINLIRRNSIRFYGTRRKWGRSRRFRVPTHLWIIFKTCCDCNLFNTTVTGHFPTGLHNFAWC